MNINRSHWERAAARVEGRQLYRDGEPVRKIAQHLGYSERNVARWVVDLPRRLGPPATDEQILAMGRRGASIRATVRALATEDKRVARLFRRAGIPIRKPGQYDHGVTNADARRRRVAS